jgi:adenine-specific DNA methylase
MELRLIFALSVLLAAPLLWHFHAQAGTNSPHVVLRAHQFGKTVWEAELLGEQEKCQISVTDGNKKKRVHNVPQKECKTLFNYLPEAKKILSSKKPIPDSNLSDEPNYELRIGTSLGSIDFLAPEECEATPDASLDCKPNPMDDAHFLLIHLRSFAKTH